MLTFILASMRTTMRSLVSEPEEGTVKVCLLLMGMPTDGTDETDGVKPLPLIVAVAAVTVASDRAVPCSRELTPSIVFNDSSLILANE